jgi:hypothetical protein
MWRSDITGSGKSIRDRDTDISRVHEEDRTMIEMKGRLLKVYDKKVVLRKRWIV